MKPLRIGISACFFHADPKRAIFKGKTLQYLEQSLAHWVMSEGAHAYLIPTPPPYSKLKLKDFVADFDGLVLEGGSDVSPKNYGEEPLKPEWAGDYIRDQYEMELVREFMAVGKPVLGVCRGAQLLNVALGGSLYQDITTQVPHARVHRDWEPYDQIFHEVEILPSTGLAKLYPGMTRAQVNTVHHQGIRNLGKGLKIEAFCPEDQIIEAIRWDGPSYVFAVQWHPEFHVRSDRNPQLINDQPILKEFLTHAEQRRNTC